MPGLVAVVPLDGRAVAEQDLATALTRLVSPRGERSATWTGAGVGLAATALVAVHGTSSPLAVEGPLVVAVDARFDDPASLGARLHGLGEARGPALSNAELVLAAYRRWGLECLSELAGDFAFVLWDAEQRRLFSARDAVGVRQLVWMQDGDRLIVASNVAAVLAVLGHKPPPNWNLLRDQIDRHYDRWIDETCFSGISRLPPAHRLIATNTGVRRERWSHLGSAGHGGVRRDEEHLDGFREALTAAVRTRLDSPSPVGILVSGGLDSSSLACLADRAAATGTAAPARLYSMVFENSPGADETEFREAVLAHCGHLPAVRVPSDHRWALCEFGPDDGFPLDEPELEVTRGQLSNVARRAMADGCGALLGGHWGDQVLGSGLYRAASALRDVPWSRLCAELPHFARLSRYPSWVLAAYGFAGALVPEGLRRSFGQRGRESVHSRCLLPAPPLTTQSARLAYYDLTSGWTAATLASLDRVGRWLGFEWRLPMLDSRVIASALALPPSLRFRGGVSRLVLRIALAGVLPEAVSQRRGRAYFDALIGRGIKQERGRIDRLLERPRVVESGLITPSLLREIVSSALYFDFSPLPCRHLANVLCVEAWLRHHE